MAELTIKVPDELAKRLQPLENRLPDLLSWLVDNIYPRDSAPELLLAVASPTDLPPVYGEVIDFLINAPSPQEIARFKVSSAAQARLRSLLYKNREATLNETEIAELDLYEQLDRLIILLKARSYSFKEK
ncbi:MAG: hypothetical protein GDA56_16680 [Hormoscilla sp. GM7CHS1pb]|nr:hypothetical protein [Hormoscilla sp. GM7CHS1pb]